MSNATYMAGVIITICIVTTIIITIIVAVLLKKFYELDCELHQLALKVSRTSGRVDGLEEAQNRKTPMANDRIDDLERKFARTVGWVEGLTGKTIKGVEVGVE